MDADAVRQKLCASSDAGLDDLAVRERFGRNDLRGKAAVPGWYKFSASSRTSSSSPPGRNGDLMSALNFLIQTADTGECRLGAFVTAPRPPSMDLHELGSRSQLLAAVKRLLDQSHRYGSQLIYFGCHGAY